MNCTLFDFLILMAMISADSSLVRFMATDLAMERLIRTEVCLIIIAVVSLSLQFQIVQI